VSFDGTGCVPEVHLFTSLVTGSRSSSTDFGVKKEGLWADLAACGTTGDLEIQAYYPASGAYHTIQGITLVCDCP
jgi:hypothetical protein